MCSIISDKKRTPQYPLTPPGFVLPIFRVLLLNKPFVYPLRGARSFGFAAHTRCQGAAIPASLQRRRARASKDIISAFKAEFCVNANVEMGMRRATLARWKVPRRTSSLESIGLMGACNGQWRCCTTDSKTVRVIQLKAWSVVCQGAGGCGLLRSVVMSIPYDVGGNLMLRHVVPLDSRALPSEMIHVCVR